MSDCIVFQLISLKVIQIQEYIIQILTLKILLNLCFVMWVF